MKKAQSAPSFGGILFQSVIRQSEFKLIIQKLQHEGCVGRTATQSGSRGNMLEEMDVYRRKVELVVQQLVGFHYQVALASPSISRPA